MKTILKLSENLRFADDSDHLQTSQDNFHREQLNHLSEAGRQAGLPEMKWMVIGGKVINKPIELEGHSLQTV